MEKEKTPQVGGFTSYDIQTLKLIDKLQNDEILNIPQFTRVWVLITKRSKNKVSALEAWFTWDGKTVEKRLDGFHRFGVFCSEDAYYGKIMRYFSTRKGKSQRLCYDEKKNSIFYL